MTHHASLVPISDAALAEQWFSLRNKTWRMVVALFRESGHEQKAVADCIGMDVGQFSRTMSGKTNAELRTFYNIARALGYRLNVEATPLTSLRKPNYSYLSRSPEIISQPNDDPHEWISAQTVPNGNFQATQ